MKITIKLSETNNALLNRVVKEEKVDASEFVNSAIFDDFLPVSPTLENETAYILQEKDKGTLTAWMIKQCISRGMKWMGKYPTKDPVILEWILSHFPFRATDTGKITTCNDYIQSEMDMVFSMLKERVPDYIHSKDKYNGFVTDVLDNWQCIWQEAAVYDVLAALVYNNDPKQDFDWYDGLNVLYLIDRAAWRQWCDA